MMERPFLAPVGFPAGLVVDDGEWHGVVRVGDVFTTLTVDEYTMWLLCFSASARSDLLAEAERQKLAAGNQELAAIEAEGLVVELSGAPVSDRSPLDQLRLELLAIGLGCTPSDSSRFNLGTFAASPMVELDAVTYAVVLRSPASGSIGDLCRGAGEELGIEPDDVAVRILAALPVLLSRGAGYLDRGI
jgi:hypothetical protein